jgi:hypothetical protein
MLKTVVWVETWSLFFKRVCFLKLEEIDFVTVNCVTLLLTSNNAKLNACNLRQLLVAIM